MRSECSALAQHLLDHLLFLDKRLLAGVDTRGQLEVVAGSAFGQVQLLNGLVVVADQGEIFGPRLVQANDVVGLAAGLCDLLPDVRVVGGGLDQLVEHLLRLG